MKRSRLVLPAVALAVLAACEPQVPNSAAPRGAGFNDYQSYSAAREAQLNGALAPGGAISNEAYAGAQPPATESSAIAAQTMAALGQPVPAAAGGAIAASPIERTASSPSLNNPGISDEQDFEAVKSRESIQSDRERIAQNAANYEVIAPTAVPQGSSGDPNIVQYALSTTNRVGETIYRRVTIAGASRSASACARYASPDLAQEDFLRSGGPQRDRKNLDPDGDGFACSWDPTPFRMVRGN